MKKLKLTGAISAILALAAGFVVYGSNLNAALPWLKETRKAIAHGANPPPDDGTGNIQVAHGANPPPDDGTGNINS
jgi:hypothetical protein